MSTGNLERIAKGLLPFSVIAAPRRARAALEAMFTPLPAEQALQEPVQIKIEGEIPGRFLIAAAQGLYLFDQGRLTRLLAGHVFGLTRHRQRWYAYRHAARKHSGEIISFRLQAGAIRNLRLEQACVDPSVHQILADEGSLYVTETHNNRLAVFRIEDQGLRRTRNVYADGWLGRQYRHLNSVTWHEGRCYVMYHNLSAKSGRPSEIAVFDKQLRYVETIQTEAGSGHNIVFPGGILTYNDSEAGAVVCGNRRFEVGSFPRGLALGDGVLLVGVSDWADRAARILTAGRVLALDLESGKTIGAMTTPGIGGVKDLAAVESD